jgi:isopenicillin-N epimerase
MDNRRVEYDEDWSDFRQQWSIRADTVYLNHGSFGPPPHAVRAARGKWQEQMDCQPMDFFFRKLESAWRAARAELATFLGTSAGNLIFVENATVAMNLVATSFPLKAGDEVALTDHEYGAVRRIWRRRCEHSGATLRTIELPRRFETTDEVVDAVVSQWTDATRLLVISHITSPTAITLPVQEIGRRAKEAGISVCLDGPHAIAQLPLPFEGVECDFYTASCHKWLSAPFGSGFLYVAPAHHAAMRPDTLSWGRLPPDTLEHWTDEFCWTGTRDSSAYLATPAAIHFLEEVGQESFRARTQHLARYARERLVECFGLSPLTNENPCWHTAMAHVPLPATNGVALQRVLWERYGIEVPIVEFQEGCFARVSCHLYNQHAEIDRLCEALRELLLT